MIRRRFIKNDKEVSFDYNNYLTIEVLENDCTISFNKTIEYGINGLGWKKLAKNESLKVANGDRISFKGNLTAFSIDGVGRFTISKSCNLEGNCMSILFGDDAANNFSLSGEVGVFYRLFYNCTTIKSVSSGFLPATILEDNCYNQMFSNCTSLTQAPTLPATTLANACYSAMFSNCTSLTQAPTLPATTLANNCYTSMFSNCTSLTQAPTLPATTLAYMCYSRIFRNCTSLTQAPTLPATTLANGCYDHMFYGCKNLNYIKALFTTTPSSSYTGNWVYGVASTGKFIKNKNATWNVTGVSGVPSGWTVVK